MDQWIREHYKSKGDFGMKTLDSRRSATLINRKEQRNTLLKKFRNIPESMSPHMSPMPPKMKETKVEKTAPKKQEAGTNKRIEMLKKWKEERERKKLEAKKKAKPLFKIYHVEHKDNLEDIYNNIKGKPTKLKEKTPLQFSENKLSKSHIPKSNENISQFKCNQPETTQILNSNKATTTSKSGTGKRVLTNRYENSQNSTTSKVPKTTSKNISNGTSTVQNNKTKSEKNSEDKQGKGVKSKLQIGTKLGSNKMSSDHARNGDKKNLPIEKSSTKQMKQNDLKSIKERQTTSVLKKSRRRSDKMNSSQENEQNLENSNHNNNDLISSSSKSKTARTPKKNSKLIQSNDSNKVKSISKRRSGKKNKSEIHQDEDNDKFTHVDQEKPITENEDAIPEVHKDDEEIKIVGQSINDADKTDLNREDSSPTFNMKNTPIKSKSDKKTQRRSRRTVENEDNENEEMSTPNAKPIKENAAEASSEEVQEKSEKTAGEDVEDNIFLNIPKKGSEEEICYVSPFVTVRRGKEAARKEFEKRKSLNGSMLNTSVSCKTDPRSPKAAAGYFTRKLNMEIARIQSLCSVWQSYKDEGNLSEDACGLIDMTIGQSNLLISKKFNQFRGLIEQCLANDDLDMKIKCEDLHGFWDMMYKQVSDLDKRFENLEDMKRNNWLEEAPRIKTPKVAVKGKKKGKAKKASKASSILKETILAARRNREKQTKSEAEIEILIATKEKTPRRKSMSKDHKELNTPGRGILKSTNIKSEKRKTVVFQNLRESTGSVKNSPISPLAVKGTPIQSRRSARISMNRSKLTFE